MTPRIALLALCLLALAPATAAAAGPGDYLRSRLQPSGGFAEAGSRRASESLSEWAVMGLAAAGRRPPRMHRRGGHTPLHYLAGRARGWHGAYALERGILAAVAMGRSPRRFGGRDLVRALHRSLRPRSGRIGGAANSTYWGVLALRAARAKLPVRTLLYLRRSQTSAGGFPWSRGAPPDTNDTAAAVMALRSAGVSCRSRTLHRAFGFMALLQGRSGGEALVPGERPDSESTAWMVQARDACGRRSPAALHWLAQRRRPSGAYNFAPDDTRTPVWVTAQVLPAVVGKHYPIR